MCRIRSCRKGHEGAQGKSSLDGVSDEAHGRDIDWNPQDGRGDVVRMRAASCHREGTEAEKNLELLRNEEVPMWVGPGVLSREESPAGGR